MSKSQKISYRPRSIKLVLDKQSGNELGKLWWGSESGLSEEFIDIGDMNNYWHPPKAPELTWPDAYRITKQKRAWLDSFYKSAYSPQSRIKIATQAWTMNVRAIYKQIDPMVKELLNDSEILLCRHILILVENEGEKIHWVQFRIQHPDIRIYELWPAESYKIETEANLEASAKLSGKIGLSDNLDFVDPTAGGEAKIVWKKSWKWVRAIVKAWGRGELEAGWELCRDSDQPFAGDREFYLMVQIPKNYSLKKVYATVKAEIKPAGWHRAWTYESLPGNPIEISYHLSNKVEKKGDIN